MKALRFELQPAIWKIILIAAAAVWAVHAAWITRSHFLDDTFIHLRIAANLIKTGHYSFNIGQGEFSTSSPLYTTLLGFLLHAWNVPHAAKALNLLVWTVIASLVILCLLKERNSSKEIVLCSSLLAITSPMGIRWLTDGMESGLVVLAGILIGFLVATISELGSLRFRPIIWPSTLIVGSLSVCLRLEFAYLLIFSSFALLLVVPSHWMRILALPTSASLGLYSIYLRFGSVLPDTAIAKSGYSSGLASTFVQVGKAHGSASLFGAFILISLLASIYALWKSYPKIRAKTLVFGLILNSFFPFLILLISIRGQLIQGIRYFLFIEAFLIAVNLLLCNPKPLDLKVFPRVAKASATFFLVVVISLWMMHDLQILNNISAGRTRTYEVLRKQNLDCLTGHQGVAWDVGMIGYYSNGQILDPNGLVNGPSVARMSRTQRLKFLIESGNPVFAFVNVGQLEDLQRHLDMSDWEAVGRYEFPNFRKGSQDEHILFIDKQILGKKNLCSQITRLPGTASS